MNYLKAQLGFKGERGYSAYEIAVQNGYEGTEQDWLATLGTSSHLSQEKAQYTSTEGQTEFDLPSNYTSDTFVDVYVDGVRLTSEEYTISNNKVVLETGLEAEKIVEVIEMTMSTNSLPIVTIIDENSTDSTSPSTKSVYDSVLSPLNTNISNVDDLISDVSLLKEDMTIVKNVDFFYPIGSIYMSVNSADPSELFGGTWELIPDRFLLGAGNDYNAGETGGEKTHTLTVSEIPSHNHELYGALTGETKAITNTGNDWAQTTTGFSNNAYIKKTGGGQAHNNMPPYLAVYIWKRIA